MKKQFSKMHGAGNDFIVFEHCYDEFPVTADTIRQLCHRTRGIGADGVIFLHKNGLTTTPNLRMTFFNCDGSRAEMCGNGLRCAAMFAGKYLVDSAEITFDTDAGELHTKVIDKQDVKIDLPILSHAQIIKLDCVDNELFYCNTGVPHSVLIVEDIDSVDVMEVGRQVRFHDHFTPEGTNVNFIHYAVNSTSVKIRTYERGVEAETSACGTGIAAAGVALAQFLDFSSPIQFITRDNDILSIEFHKINNMVSNVKLTGPAVEVFSGEVVL